MSGSRRSSPRTSPRASRQTVLRLSMRVWDLPTRLFAWAVAAMTALGTASAAEGWTQVCYQADYAVLVLLLFRLAWGFVGSETARFSHFLRGPAAVAASLRQFAGRAPDDSVGHSAAGGWMVLALLAALAVQAISALFGDGPKAAGPLAHLADAATNQRLTTVHAVSSAVVLGLAALLVLAFAAAAVRQHNLLRPMITGRKRLPGNFRQPRTASPLLALMLLALAACVVWIVVTRL